MDKHSNRVRDGQRVDACIDRLPPSLGGRCGATYPEVKAENMAELTEQKLGYWFGVLGGGLLLVGALVSFLVGIVDLAAGRAFGAIDAWSATVLLGIVGGLSMLFARLAYRSWNNRPLSGGILLIVVAVVGWAALGLGANVLALVGALFVFLAGVLFLIEPVKREVSSLATA